jgi:hypothetical protein
VSWVDLAALVLVLWCAAKGYLAGVCQAFLHMCAVLFSVFVAGFLQKSLLVYLNQEWQAETLLVNMLIRNAGHHLKAGTEQSVTFTSSLSLALMRRLSPGVSLPVAGGQEAAATASVLAGLILWGASIFILFLLAALTVTLLLRIIKLREQNKERREWQKIGGLIFGLAKGLILSVIFCLVLDVICCTDWLGFLRQDIYNSYLHSVTNVVVQLIV